MLDYPALQALATVVQTGSFEKAAAALHVTPSAISQRVKLLEERLGTVLVARGTPCTATETGAWLCRHVEHVGMLEKELRDRLPGLADPADTRRDVTLHIATNADSLGIWFLKAAAPFAREAGYLLDVVVDDEEHTAEWLRRGRVLAAVTALGKPVQGCRMMPLGTLRYHATASPAFLARHFPAGVNARSLAAAPSLTFNQKDRMQGQWLRQVLGREIACPTHWLPSTQAFVEACVLGMGWAMNPEPLTRALLREGRLVELIPDTPLDVPLFWQVNRLAAERIAGLTREVATAARQALHGEDG